MSAADVDAVVKIIGVLVGGSLCLGALAVIDATRFATLGFVG
jgi:hypothetical protein